MCVNFCIIYKKAQLWIVSFLDFWNLFSEIWEESTKATTRPRSTLIIPLTSEGTTEPYPSTSPSGFDSNEDENR